MKTEIFLLVAACCVFVHGKSIDNTELKREMLLKALARIKQNNPQRFFGWFTGASSPSTPTTSSQGQYPFPGNRDDVRNSLLTQIQGLLGALADTIGGFRKTGAGSSGDPQLQAKLDEADGRVKELINRLEEILNGADMEFSLWDIYDTLVMQHGSAFDDAFWDTMLGDYPTRDLLTASSPNNPPTLLDKVQDMLNDVDYIAFLVDSIVEYDQSAGQIVQAILHGLEAATGYGSTGSTVITETTTNAPPSTTSYHWWNMFDWSTTGSSTSYPGGSSTSYPWWNWKRSHHSALRQKLLDLLAKTHKA